MRNIALGSGISCATLALAPLASTDTMSGTYKATVLEDDHHYESLARKGETMSTDAMVIYAYDQIDQVRAELNEVSK